MSDPEPVNPHQPEIKTPPPPKETPCGRVVMVGDTVYEMTGHMTCTNSADHL